MNGNFRMTIKVARKMVDKANAKLVSITPFTEVNSSDCANHQNI
tara:strand:- start:601 stop:732 length:132 start_codon:yes stop_codon:yes gene_type:complete